MATNKTNETPTAAPTKIEYHAVIQGGKTVAHVAKTTSKAGKNVMLLRIEFEPNGIETTKKDGTPGKRALFPPIGTTFQACNLPAECGINGRIRVSGLHGVVTREAGEVTTDTIVSKIGSTTDKAELAKMFKALQKQLDVSVSDDSEDE